MVAIFLVFTIRPTPAANGDASVPLFTKEVLQRLEENYESRPRSSASIEVRHYMLRNARFKRESEMDVQVIRRADGALDFKVLKVSGSEQIFKRILEGEAALSRLPVRERSLTASNYEFKLLGTESVRSNRCYVLQLIPRRKSKYLLQGRAWFDTETLGLVRLEGRPVASISLWVGKPLIVQEFEQLNGAWTAVGSHTTASTRILGTTELSIEHRDHHVLESQDAADAMRVGLHR